MSIQTATRLPILRAIAVGVTLGAGASVAQAQSFDFVLNQPAGTGTLAADYAVELDANLRGNYDPVTNPGGTRTVLGTVPGPGNDTVPFDLEITGILNHTGGPTGSLGLDLDLVNLTFDMTGLDVDLLGGTSLPSDFVLNVLFTSTFQTFNPNSAYPAGIPVSLPLTGQSVSEFVVEQSVPSFAGVLTAGLGAGHYDFSALVPVSISMVATIQGVPAPVGPWDGFLPVSGEVVVSGGLATLTMDTAYVSQQVTIDPLPGYVLADVPFDAPTLFPAAGTAHMLMGGTVDQVVLDVNLTASLVADGAPSCGFTSFCAANVNSTGMVAELTASGSLDVGQQDLTLSVSDLPTYEFGYFLMSPVQGYLALPAPSQGVLCVGGPFYRLNSVSNILFTGGTGAVSLALDFNNLPQGQVFLPGSVWNFQLWHRDTNPMSTSNTSTGIEVRFCQ